MLRRCGIVFLLLAVWLAAGGCGDAGREAGSVVRIADGGKIVSLDPALAADVGSQRLVNAFFDTLLQYDYPHLPYRLKPSMLAAMPEVSADGRVYRFTLRDDLYFFDDPCFAGLPPEARKVDAQAVIFSLLRLGDARLHSATYSLFRGKIEGLTEFNEATQAAPEGDCALYDAGIPGLRALDAHSFEIRLTDPDPRFLYLLAIPCTGVVSRRAVECYGESFSEHPVGSGPFRLDSWIREYKIAMVRNDGFRREYFPAAADPADRTRPLPLADRIECFNTRQAQASWLLFLQGELDMSVITRDNTDLIAAGNGGELAPALAERGIELLRAPSLEIQYVGFSFTDPVLARNVALRRAVSLAYDIPRLIRYANGQMLPTAGPLPPGLPEYREDFTNAWNRFDLEEAKRQLALAGYPDGVDPATGEALTLTLDLNGNSPLHRQIGEMFASDMAKIGLRIVPVLNNSPRFYQKLAAGRVQLFRLSWKGDYPDAENFLQLFYSGNIGGANRVSYSNSRYDALFLRYLAMAPGAERDALLRDMLGLLADDAPWIFETVPVTYHLKHGWLDNYLPYDFSFGAWKYLTVHGAERDAAKRAFTPLRLDELQ